MAAGAGTHYPLPSGPDGAESWCALDQQYCGGTSPAGNAIACACCGAAGPPRDPAPQEDPAPGAPAQPDGPDPAWSQDGDGA